MLSWVDGGHEAYVVARARDLRPSAGRALAEHLEALAEQPLSRFEGATACEEPDDGPERDVEGLRGERHSRTSKPIPKRKPPSCAVALGPKSAGKKSYPARATMRNGPTSAM